MTVKRIGIPGGDDDGLVVARALCMDEGQVMLMFGLNSHGD